MLSINDCRDILNYYHIPHQSSLRKLKEKSISLFQSRICKSNLPFVYLFKRQSKNFRMTRKQRLTFYLV